MAILFINVFALCAVGQGLVWKIASKQGGHIIDYQFMRCVCVFTLAVIQTCYAKTDPFKAMPRTSWKDMIIRSLGGQLTFGLANFSFTLIALGTVAVILNTNAFWIAILACAINKERVSAVEVVGIFLAFTGVLMVGYSKKTTDEGE